MPTKQGILYLPSVVESERFPPADVAPDSLSELPRTPESALQEPRSPAAGTRQTLVLIPFTVLALAPPHSDTEARLS